ncbi:MAG: MFS transporter [Chloroflexi bacterium]|nr:MAG: MFS transporter [Chloroflexota bacterium]
MTDIKITRWTQWRITAVLFADQSLFSAGVIAAFTLMPILAAELSGQDSLAGVPSTVLLLGRAIAAYPIGWLMDRWGRRWGLSVGYGVGALGWGLAAWGIMASSFWGFCFGAGLVGMGRSASEQGRYVAAEVFPAERRARIIGLVVFAGTIGAIGGPQLVEPAQRWAAAQGLVGSMGPYLAALVLNGVALGLTFLFLRPDPLQLGLAVRPVTDEMAGQERPFRLLLASPVRILAVLAMVIGQLVMTLIMVITPLHMNHHAHGTGSIATVVMAHTLGMYGLSGVTGRLVDKYGRFPVIFWGTFILIASALITPLSPSVLNLSVALFLLGLGWNFCFVAGSSLLSDGLTAVERGRIQGVGEMLVAVASGLGGLGSGFVFDGGGIVGVTVVALAFTLALATAYIYTHLTQKSTLAPHPGPEQKFGE